MDNVPLSIVVLPCTLPLNLIFCSFLMAYCLRSGFAYAKRACYQTRDIYEGELRRVKEGSSEQSKTQLYTHWE